LEIAVVVVVGGGQGRERDLHGESRIEISRKVTPKVPELPWNGNEIEKRERSREQTVSRKRGN